VSDYFYLYGLVNRPDLAAALAGHPVEGLGGTVGALQSGDISLALTPCDTAEILPKRRSMKQHLGVLEQLMSFGTVLPFRFGHVTPDPQRILGLIETSADAIRRSFAAVAGHAELGVRIDYDRDMALAATLATDHALRTRRDHLNARGGGARMEQIELGRRAAEALDARRGAAQRHILKQLIPLARDHVLQAPEQDTQVLKAAFLVAESGQDAFSAALEVAALECSFAPGGTPKLALVGPVPPFNFVSFSLETAGAERSGGGQH